MKSASSRPSSIARDRQFGLILSVLDVGSAVPPRLPSSGVVVESSVGGAEQCDHE